MNKECSICREVDSWRQGQNPFVIAEFDHCLWVAGPHQFHQGYTLLLLKNHVRDLHDLEPHVHDALFREVRTAARAVVAACKPWRMNYAALGNQVQHVHVHLFPRYETDPDHLQHPWHRAQEFEQHRIDAEQAQEITERLRAHLSLDK